VIRCSGISTSLETNIGNTTPKTARTGQSAPFESGRNDDRVGADGDVVAHRYSAQAVQIRTVVDAGVLANENPRRMLDVTIAVQDEAATACAEQARVIPGLHLVPEL
jgi:hypothetical protein